MKYLPFIFALFFLASCEKEIFIDLEEAETRIVIEGNITNEQGAQTIKISKTVGFSAPNRFPAVSGASVTLSDNTGWSETLTETSAGTYQTSPMTGQVGKTYTLKVVHEGKTYTASSTMPALVPLVDLRLEENIFGPPTPEPTYYVVPVFQDPSVFGNCYRFVQSLNDKKDNAYIIFNDNVNNGLINERPIFSQELEIKKGNKLTVEMRCIDKPIHDYFLALSQLTDGSGATPANPTSNIAGGALGYFSAHTVERITIIVP
jgi:hypothetical protein